MNYNNNNNKKSGRICIDQNIDIGASLCNVHKIEIKKTV